MKPKPSRRLKKIATTLEDVATEIGMVDPPLQLPSKGPKVGAKRGGSILPDKPQNVGKTAQKGRKKIKGIPE